MCVVVGTSACMFAILITALYFYSVGVDPLEFILDSQGFCRLHADVV